MESNNFFVNVDVFFATKVLEALSGVARQYANGIIIGVNEEQGGDGQFDIVFLVRAGKCPNEFADILDE